MNTLIYGYLFYYISALIGITIGYHRYFTHNSFKTNKYTEVLLLLFGLVCGGRSALTWCAVHSMHHDFSDSPKDPHSPKFKGILAVIFSTWKIEYIPKKYIQQLIVNPRLRFFHKYGSYMYMMYGLITLLISLNAFIIFFLVPLIISWLGFGILNYVTHKTGSPEDIPLMNIIAPGEGWHKTHHDNPHWYYLNKWDPAKYVVKFIKND